MIKILHLLLPLLYFHLIFNASSFNNKEKNNKKKNRFTSQYTSYSKDFTILSRWNDMKWFPFPIFIFLYPNKHYLFEAYVQLSNSKEFEYLEEKDLYTLSKIFKYDYYYWCINFELYRNLFNKTKNWVKLLKLWQMRMFYINGKKFAEWKELFSWKVL